MESHIVAYLILVLLFGVWSYVLVISLARKSNPPMGLLLVFVLFPFSGLTIKIGPLYLDILVLNMVLGLFIHSKENLLGLPIKDTPKNVIVMLLASILGGMIFWCCYRAADISIAATHLVPQFWWINVVLKSFSEEVFFRGFLLRFMQKYSVSIAFANILQASIFALSHLNSNSSPNLVLLLFLFGLVAGIIVSSKRNLLYSSTMHIVTNLLLLLIE